MTHKSTSLLAQIITTIIDQPAFNRIVREHQGDKHSKGLKCWDQFVAMMFLHLSKMTSLREIVGGLRTAAGKLVHLRLAKVHPHSTLAYANAHRPWQIYRDLFYAVLLRCRATLQTGKTFRFKNKVLSMDATQISLCLELFDWAKYLQTKGAVKVHLLLDHEGYFPVFAQVSDAKTHETVIARQILLDCDRVPAGSIIVFDRAYVDFKLLAALGRRGVFFITRLKRGMKWKKLWYRRSLRRNAIRFDYDIRLTSQKAKIFGQQKLRLVKSKDPRTGESIVLLTNMTRLAASTIARVYRDRWQIEVFFRTIKQHLKIKTFVGTTQNALLIQIWTALITILVLKYLKALSTFSWSLSNLVALLRLSLFTYRDLLEWLGNPFSAPPWDPEVQIAMEFG